MNKMSFIEEIKEMEKSMKNTEEEILTEMVDYFEERLNRESYLIWLKDRIKEEIEKSNGTYTLRVKFTDYYYDDNEIYCSGIRREYKSHYIKDNITFIDLQDKICDRLSVLLKNKLTDLGFMIIGDWKDNSKRRYTRDITIKW